MPLLTIETNTKTGDSPAWLTELSTTTANMLGKPESYVMVISRYNPDMLFAGNNQPSAFLELKSLGLPEDRTAEFSAVLCELIHKHLGIEPNRIYIQFSNPERHLWGWNSTTF